MSVIIEIVEGPDAGRQVKLEQPVVIGRDGGADVVLDDSQASRRHARLTPTAAGAVVEDLGSTNGTLVNGNEVHAPVELREGDELIVGVTPMEVRSTADVLVRPSAVRPIPPGLAVAERRPTFTDPVEGAAARPETSAVPELERLRDSRTKGKARLAPVAIFVLVALVVVIYLGAT